MSATKAATMTCTECGAEGIEAIEFHPYLFCELIRLGHRGDMEQYLSQYGFSRTARAEALIEAFDPTSGSQRTRTFISDLRRALRLSS